MQKFRYIAPAGTRIKFTELSGWLLDLVTARDRTEEFRTALSEKYGIRHCFLMSSGRAALAMIFKVLADLEPNSQRNEIILPAYTCYSVPAAAELSGLKIRICEIDPDTLDYDPKALSNVDTSRVLALVSANLYGYPNNLPFLESFCQKLGIYFIDDAAQSMNASMQQRFAGTFGDIGIYSLDKGKNITTIQGGIVVTNNDLLASKIDAVISRYPYPTHLNRLSEIITILIYSLLLHPRLYWIPANISWLGLGKTIYTTDYLFTRYSRHLSSLAMSLFSRIDEITSARCRLTREIQLRLESLPGMKFIRPIDQSSPACLRNVLLLDDANKRDILLQAMTAAGIGASISYPQSLTKLENVQHFRCDSGQNPQNGEYVADRILTLPTLSHVSENDLVTIKRVFENTLA